MPQYKSTSARILLALLLICAIQILPNRASATITQGDFSIFGNLTTRWDGRFGEGGPRTDKLDNVVPSGRGGGSFAFDRWDLVSARQEAELRPDYHVIKNFNFLGRLDTLFVKEADVFAIYRGWYDAFGDFKPKGIGQAAKDLPEYTQREKVSKFQRDDLREYYAEIDVNDNLAFRVGKQQVIWTEADALSGTEVLNPADLRYHFIHFESPEDQRRNIRMVKMTYVLGDIWKTSNNEFEAYWIPDDFEGGVALVNTSDPRDPYVVRFADTNANYTGTQFANMEGIVMDSGTFADGPRTNTCCLTPVNASATGPLGPQLNALLGPQRVFLDFPVAPTRHNAAHWHGLDHAEGGVRWSTLLPIGNGLQMSFIWHYLARAQAVGTIDSHGPRPACLDAGTCLELLGPDPGAAVAEVPGVYGVVNTTGCNKDFQEPKGGLKMVGVGGDCVPPGMSPRIGFIQLDIYDQVRRTNYLGLSGTYYEKDLTDIVIRYDFGYKAAVAYLQQNSPGKILNSSCKGCVQTQWTDEFTGIVAFDRPTYIPWISKQHTFFVAQWVTNWFINAHQHDIQTLVSAQGKLRQYQNVAFVAAADWLFDGRLVTTNVVFWDADSSAGFFGSTNLFRYNRNVLMGMNLQWYLGRSGRYTDPFTMSRDQRINEMEFKLTYEI